MYVVEVTMAVQENGKRLLSQQDVADIFGVSESTIRNWRKDRLLSYVQVPGSSRKFYFKAEVEAFIDRCTKHRKGGGPRLIRSENQKGEPRISSTRTDEDWRIE
jgi:predicted DNA-binding transcriptional regulator AlpA